MGEQVLALGYADLDFGNPHEADDRPMRQYLYGSFGNIIDIENADGARGRPWPQLRVEADWPGGMSGGPVFNEAGHVVGLLSTGMSGHGVSTATFFQSWDVPERIFRSLDASNPRRFRCYAVFDAGGELLRCSQDEDEIEEVARRLDLADVAVISIDPWTGDYLRE